MTQLEILDTKSHDLPNPTIGVEGMIVAHEILKENKTAGVLIGGCARALYERNITHEQFNAHKDVDVLILRVNWRNDPKKDNKFFPKLFEGGIDWWVTDLLEEDTGPYTDAERKSCIGVNGNGALLHFDVMGGGYLPSGLHIPSDEFVKRMIMADAKNRLHASKEVCSEIYDQLNLADKFYPRTLLETWGYKPWRLGYEPPRDHDDVWINEEYDPNADVKEL